MEVVPEGDIRSTINDLRNSKCYRDSTIFDRVKLVQEYEQSKIARKIEKIKEIENILLDEEIDINIKYKKIDVVIDGMIKDDDHTLRRSGAYIVTTESGHIYIGSTKNLRVRLQDHVNKQMKHCHTNIFEPIKSVVVYVTDNPIDAKILEYWLIKQLKPQLNFEFIIDKTNRS